MMKDWILVRGGGDLATGTIYKLCKSGFPVLITEIAHPSAIRRYVAFSEAVYEKNATVENMTCTLVEDWEQACSVMNEGRPALMVDPNCEILKEHHPSVVVDFGVLVPPQCGVRLLPGPARVVPEYESPLLFGLLERIVPVFLVERITIL